MFKWTLLLRLAKPCWSFVLLLFSFFFPSTWHVLRMDKSQYPSTVVTKFLLQINNKSKSVTNELLGIPALLPLIKYKRKAWAKFCVCEWLVLPRLCFTRQKGKQVWLTSVCIGPGQHNGMRAWPWAPSQPELHATELWSTSHSLNVEERWSTCVQQIRAHSSLAMCWDLSQLSTSTLILDLENCKDVTPRESTNLLS